MNSEESMEVSAPSVDEAIIIGLTRLGVTRDEVEIHVLDEGSRGFFGIGSREAVVRLTRRPQPAPVEAPAPAPEPQLEPEPDPEPTPEAEAPSAPPPPEPQESVSEPEPTPEAPEPRAPQPEEAPSPARPHREKQPEQPKKPALDAAKDGLDYERIEEVAQEVAANLFGALNLEVVTTWRKEDRPTLWISLRGKDADALVGPRAQTLHAAQYILRALVHHKIDGNYNIVLDADGYRHRRRRSLETLARKMADRAVQSGRPVRLKPMPAHERRMIHIVLRSDDRVTTESSGTGRHRAITIIPGKNTDR